jgi:hypothetical protein
MLNILADLLLSPPTPCDPDTVRVLKGSNVLLTASHAVPHAQRAALERSMTERQDKLPRPSHTSPGRRP